MKAYRLTLILAAIAAVAVFAVPPMDSMRSPVGARKSTPRVIARSVLTAEAPSPDANFVDLGDEGGTGDHSRGRSRSGSLDCFTSRLSMDSSQGPQRLPAIDDPYRVEMDGAVMRLLPNRVAASRSEADRGNSRLDEGNDRCPATVIPSLPYTDTGLFKDKHTDISVYCLDGYGFPDVIYQYTPDHNGEYLLAYTGDFTAGGIGVRTGGACPGSQEVHCESEWYHAPESPQNMVLTLTSGQTYFVVLIADTQYNHHNYTFRMSEVGECSADMSLTAPGVISGNTCLANDDCPYVAGADQIVRVTIPRDGRWTFDLCDGRTWDADLYLSRSCCSDTILSHATYGCDYLPPDWVSRPAIGPITLTAGEYFIRVEGNHPLSCGLWTLNVTEVLYPTCTTRPVNDDLVNVGPPVHLPAVFTGDNRCATHDCALLTEGQGETWHAFELDAAADVIVDFCGLERSFYSRYRVLVAGAPCNRLVQASEYNYINCEGTWGYIMVFQNLPAGVYYYPMLRDSIYSAEGPYTINIRSLPTCEIVSEPGDVIECPDNADLHGRGIDCDGGCMRNGQYFVSIAPGQSVFGDIYTYPDPQYNYRHADADWYEFALEDTAVVTVAIRAEFPVSLTLTDRDCSYQYQLANASAVLPCTTLVLSSTCLRPGSYAVVVQPMSFLVPTDAAHYRFTLTSNPCDWPIDLVQEAGDQLENEPICQDNYQDVYNSGCSGASIFQTIPSTVTLFGTSGIYRAGNYHDRDTDWFQFTITRPSVVSVRVLAEFDPYLVLTNFCPGCDGGLMEAGGTVGDTLEMRSWCFEPGLYYLAVLPSSGARLPCGTEYRLWLQSDPCAPCVNLGVPGDIPENEPPCSSDTRLSDHYNGGCNTEPPVYGPTLTCGQAVWGRTGSGWGYNGPMRDTDWLLFNMASSDIPHFNVVAQFPVMTAIVGPGPLGCDSVILYSDITVGNPCETVTVSPSAPLPAGPYWLYIAPTAFRRVVCGLEYRASVQCASCQPDTVTDLTIRRVGDDIVLRWTADPAFAGSYTVYAATSYPASPDAWQLVATGVAPQIGARKTTYTRSGAVMADMDRQYYMVVGVCP
jgi:hypothetical protein